MTENNRYAKGKIYKIWSPQIDLVYIGSTTKNTLAERMATHKYHFKKDIRITSKCILKYDDAKIELIENYPCNNRDELNAREGYYIRTTDCVNKRIECRTKKEWRDENKEYCKEHNKQYQQDNLDILKKYRKEYYEANKEKIKEYQKLRRIQKKNKFNFNYINKLLSNLLIYEY